MAEWLRLIAQRVIEDYGYKQLWVGKIMRDQKGTWVNFQVDATTNAWLTESAKRSGRQKRSEAALRLKDHLARFQSIAAIGEVVERDKTSQERDA